MGSPECGEGDVFRATEESWRKDDDDGGESLVLEEPGDGLLSIGGPAFDVGRGRRG